MNEMHSFGAHSTAHLNKSDVELYVINALAVARAAEVESHVACCEACAEALAREAQLEMALEILAERTSFDAESDIDAMRTELTHAEIAHPPVAPVLLPALDRLSAAFAIHAVANDVACDAPGLVTEPSKAASAVKSPSAPLLGRRARTGLAFAGALAAAAALVIWVMPGAKSEPNDDVAAYGTVSVDAAGAMVSFEHNAKPNLDKLDGG